MKLSDIHEMNAEYNALRIAYFGDDDYWYNIKHKEMKRDVITNPIESLNARVSKIEMKTDLKQLENINIDMFIDGKVTTRGIGDAATYIYNLVYKVFSYLNSNQEELKNIILNIETLIQGLKEMYEKMNVKQAELYERTLTPEEQKKLAEEKKQQEIEKQHEQEDVQMKFEEIQKMIDAINSMSSFCNAEANPDMKNMMNMYSMAKNIHDTEISSK
jgi:hypothetical protein